MQIRRSIVGQTNVCCNRYRDGTIFVGALTDFMHRSVKSRVAKSPRTQTHPTATVEAVRASCSWSVIRMNGLGPWPSRPGRMKHSSWSTLFCGLRGSTTFSRRCCRRRVLGGSCGARRSVSRSCRPSWETCATLLDHLGILVGLSSSRPAGPMPLPCVQVLALLAGAAQIPVR